jgi:hypothetical protein
LITAYIYALVHISNASFLLQNVIYTIINVFIYFWSNNDDDDDDNDDGNTMCFNCGLWLYSHSKLFTRQRCLLSFVAITLFAPSRRFQICSLLWCQSVLRADHSQGIKYSRLYDKSLLQYATFSTFEKKYVCSYANANV